MKRGSNLLKHSPGVAITQRRRGRVGALRPEGVKQRLHVDLEQGLEFLRENGFECENFSLSHKNYELMIKQ